MAGKFDHATSIMTARPILSRSRARPKAGDGSDVGRALGRVMAEIDGIAVSTLKSITLTTLLKIVELTCPQYPVTRHESPDTGGRSDLRPHPEQPLVICWQTYEAFRRAYLRKSCEPLPQEAMRLGHL